MIANKTELLFSKFIAKHVCQRYATTVPPMPSCDHKPPQYKGPSYDASVKVRKENVNPSLIIAYKKPLLLHHGHMQWLWDHEGRRYLDMSGGIVTVGIGHCHPKVVAALHKQADSLWHMTTLYLNPKVVEYTEKLVSRLPGNLKVAYIVNSGSEANDLAIFMARLYTKRYDIISLQNAYHGVSPHLMGLTAMSNYRHVVPAGFGMHQAITPDVYKGAFGGKNCRDSPVQALRNCDCAEGQCMAGDKYVQEFENTIKYSTPKQGLAGFIAESIQGAGGTVQFPRNFLKRAFDAVRAKGGVCISDEVQTGFGRTGGKFWHFEDHGVQPDMVTVAKSIGNGFPLAAVVTTTEIAKPMADAMHFNTYGGNPLACAVGSAVLDAIDENKYMENSRVLGNRLLSKMESLRNDFEMVGDVRGKGLFTGLELVQSKACKKPISGEKSMAIWEETRNMGVLFIKGGVDGNIFRIKPPMCVTEADIDFAMAVMRRALEIHAN